MSKHGQEYNERTPAPGVEEVVAVRVERYGMAYKGILPDDAIERSKAHWRNELLDFADVLLTTHQQEKEALQEYYEKQMTDAYHSGFVAGQGDKEALVREILSKQSKPWNYRLDEPGTVAMVEVKDIRAIAARHGITSDTLTS